MHKIRPEEEWARQILERNLDTQVVGHDDGRRDSMHDLEIRYPTQRIAAVEVTAAADGASIAIWNYFNGRSGRWIERQLVGGWSVSLQPSARLRKVRQELPNLLGCLESSSRTALRVGSRGDTESLEVVAKRLGVSWARQYDTGFPGSIYIEPDLPRERTGGMVADDGDFLAEWVGMYLSSAPLTDLRKKLSRSLAFERHAFVILPGFATAPFAVIDLLMRPSPPLPSIPPLLPWQVTHVWTASTWTSGTGMRWSPVDGWRYFTKPTEDN